MMLSELRHRLNTTTPAERLCSKLQDYTGTGNIYAYSPNSKQHAVRRIYNGLTNELYNLRWDNNGNLAQQTVYSVNNNTTNYQTMRMLFWDEDDRLNLVAGDGYLSYYAYGHDGNRAIKMTGNAAIDQTATLLNSTNLENITIYPNEYLTVTQAEYTKYYYAGGNRIASKIGTGGFEKMQRLCTYDANITYNANTLLNYVLYHITNPTNQAQDAVPVETCNGYNFNTQLLAEPLPTLYITQTNLNFSQNNLLQQFRQNLAGGTEAVYYFHSDHLGSASWITNNTGLPVQHLQYLPFGEHFVNERSAAYDERFTFTGKERDAETGFYYHGARFNSSDIGWLSVDPMSDKYPSISPYAYCAWNPIKLVDEEGDSVILSSDAREIHEQYYKVNKVYTEVFDKLNKTQNFLFVFSAKGETPDVDNSTTEGGTVVEYYPPDEGDDPYENYVGNIYIVQWGDAQPALGGSANHVFLEEMFHAKQILDYGNNRGTIEREVRAKEFAVTVDKNIINYCDSKNYKKVPTQLSIIQQFNYIESCNFLKKGKIDIIVEDVWGNKCIGSIPGAYANFPDE